MIREVQPTGPYRVAGWSSGGVLAYEIASQLVGQNETVEFVGLIDTAAPAYARAVGVLPALPDDPAAPADSDDGAEFEAYVARLVAAGKLRDHVTVPFREMAYSRVNGQALRGYHPRPLPVAVHLFTAQDNTAEGPTDPWRDVVPGRLLRVTPVPGTHFTIVDPPNVAVLGEALSRGLGEQAAQRRGRERPVR
jgi:thioesterase domain-containing protein